MASYRRKSGGNSHPKERETAFLEEEDPGRMQFGSDTHTQNKVTCCENEESKDSGLCGLWGVGELSDVSLKDIPCRKVLSAWDELEL